MTIESAALTITYRALVMTADHRMSLEERNGDLPAPGAVTIEVIATGICGSDIHGLAGDTGRRETGQVMGHETVGRVVGIGDGVDRDLLGRVVTVNPVFGCGECAACEAGQPQKCATGWVLGVRPDVDGAFAERLTVPAGNVVELPKGMEPWHGALAEPLSVGYHAVLRGAPQPDDRVLIIGGGPIGQAAALAARRVGVAAVLVSEPDTRRTEIVRSLGFSTVAPDQLPTAVERDLGGPATLVIDAVGTSRTIGTALDVSSTDARIVLVGMGSPQLEFSAYQVSAGERSLIGAFCYSVQDFTSTVEWLARHPESAVAIVDRVAPLAEGAAVFDELLSGSLSNKVLLAPRPEEVGL